MSASPARGERTSATWLESLGSGPPSAWLASLGAPGRRLDTRSGFDCPGHQLGELLGIRFGSATLEQPAHRSGDEASLERLAGRTGFGRYREQQKVAHLGADEPPAAADKGALSFRVGRFALEGEVSAHEPPQLRVATLPGRAVAVDGGNQLGNPLDGHRSLGMAEGFEHRL